MIGPHIAKITLEYKNGLTTIMEGEVLSSFMQDWALQGQAKAILDQMNANAEAQRIEQETGGKVVSLANAIDRKGGENEQA